MFYTVEPGNGHLTFIDNKTNCGPPIYAGFFDRLTRFRPHQVMENFMRERNMPIQHTSGLLARIRCIGSPAEHLFARS